jgi:hypothetical protein
MGGIAMSDRTTLGCAKCVAVLIPLFFAGCGGGTKAPSLDKNGNTPQEVALKAFDAAKAGDYDKANSYCTTAYAEFEKADRAKWEAEGKPSKPNGGWPYVSATASGVIDHYEMGTVTVHDESTVTIDVERVRRGGAKDPCSVSLTKKDGVWKLGLFDRRTADGKVILK